MARSIFSNAADRKDTDETSRIRSAAGYAWGVLALATCPCHLPLVLGLLAGTSAGAIVGAHWVPAAAILTVVFALSFGRALSMLRR